MPADAAAKDPLATLGLTRDEHGYVDAEGLNHDTLEDALTNALGICGCGRPEDVLAIVRAELTLASNRDLQRADDPKPLEWWLLYTLDRLGLTEHGCAVLHAWISTKGRAFLALLEQVDLSGAEPYEIKTAPIRSPADNAEEWEVDYLETGPNVEYAFGSGPSPGERYTGVLDEDGEPAILVERLKNPS